MLGISADSKESHAAWRETLGLPYPLLVDEGDAVRESYGIPKDLFGLLKGRQTYVIDEDGLVQLIFNSQLDAEAHVAKTLAVLAK